jgi:hypothetical protein
MSSSTTERGAVSENDLDFIAFAFERQKNPEAARWGAMLRLSLLVPSGYSYVMDSCRVLLFLLVSDVGSKSSNPAIVSAQQVDRSPVRTSQAPPGSQISSACIKSPLFSLTDSGVEPLESSNRAKSVVASAFSLWQGRQEER